VFVGNFNPKIFQPSWFAAEGLIGKQDAEEAKVEVIHPDISIFSLEWVKVQVLRERFSVETKQEPYDEALRDIAFGTFTILKHTPLTKMGINMFMHFRVESDAKWHAIGHKLAPKDIWEGVLQKPGMKSLAMEEYPRRDGYNGYIQVKIEPSSQVKPGLFFGINDHIAVKDPENATGSDEIVNLLKEIWPESHKRSETIIYSLLERVSA
jgi:Cu/Ag efflux protein CusF